MNGDIKPVNKRGFFCDDTSITYPFRKETIDLKTLMLVALIVPGLIVKFCDNWLKKTMSNLNQVGRRQTRKAKKRRKSDDVIDVEEEELIAVPDDMKRRQLVSGENDSVSDTTNKSKRNDDDNDDDEANGEVNLFTRIPLDSDEESKRTTKTEPSQDGVDILQRNFGEFQIFFFGLITTMLFTGIGKVTCGRLRPHFMQRCIPDIDCSSKENANKYIENFVCTNSQLRSRDLSYITTSWPSGKSSC